LDFDSIKEFPQPARRLSCIWWHTLTEVFLNPTEVFPYFFLSCKANARAKLAKTGHGPHSSTLVVICVVRLLFLLFYVLFVCKCVLPPATQLQLINISYHIIKFIIQFRKNRLTRSKATPPTLSDTQTHTQSTVIPQASFVPLIKGSWLKIYETRHRL